MTNMDSIHLDTPIPGMMMMMMRQQKILPLINMAWIRLDIPTMMKKQKMQIHQKKQ